MTAHHRTREWSALTRVMRPRIAASLPAPCVDCRRPVLADQSWQVGHIVSVAQATRMGWSVREINDQQNLGPSHSNCNASAGGRLGASIANRRRAARKRLRQW